MTALSTFLVTSSALVLVASCARTEDRVSTTVTTGARRHAIMNDDAAMMITNARCQAEDACGNVGAFRRFVNRDACTHELFSEGAAIVRAEACPLGVDEGGLSRCLSALRTQRCDDQRQSVHRLASCRDTELCITR